MSRVSVRRTLIGLAAAGLAVVIGCAINPATGKRELNFVSTSQEIAMGREADKQVLSEYGAYEDTSLAGFVDRIGHKLAAVSERPDLEWHFRLLDSPVVNAFALPGGYIYITRGIVAAMNSEAQLAGVIGHEIGHVTARHTAEQITRSQIAGVGLLAGMVLSSDVARYGELAQQSLGLLFLKFSRDDETQADELGIRYCVRAGYDPREIPPTYDMLGRLALREGGGLPSWLSTHPDPGDRKVRTSTLSHEAVLLHGEAGLVVNEDSFKRRLEGLVYGDDPRNGYLVDNHFYHPALGFEMIWPNGWNVENSAAAVVGQSPDGRAAIQLTLEETGKGPDDPAAYVEYLLKEGKLAQADGRARTINGMPSWVGHAVGGNRKSAGADAPGDQAAGSPGGQTAGEVVALAFFRRAPGSLYQFLAIPGRTDADGRFSNTVESFGPLRDTTQAQRKPDRIDMVSAPGDRTMEAFTNAQKNLARPADELSWLNHYFLRDVPAKGKLLKMVRRG